MQIRKTAAEWRTLNISPIRTDKIKVDNLGNGYMHCSIGEGLRTSWCWRSVTDAPIKKEALSWGQGEYEVCLNWL
jgi:hypothetical protein